jgi:hypothetical protein
LAFIGSKKDSSLLNNLTQTSNLPIPEILNNLPQVSQPPQDIISIISLMQLKYVNHNHLPWAKFQKTFRTFFEQGRDVVNTFIEK